MSESIKWFVVEVFLIQHLSLVELTRIRGGTTIGAGGGGSCTITVFKF